ncbi:hypothetical protein ACFWIN_13450 [Streptomyces sp. NPDC127049]|uniref:hypothetical protein n=1 Tax=Streptomyces sp. NPDC127049 TaxID=3347118 RepID=UPI00364F3711
MLGVRVDLYGPSGFTCLYGLSGLTDRGSRRGFTHYGSRKGFTHHGGRRDFTHHGGLTSPRSLAGDVLSPTPLRRLTAPPPGLVRDDPGAVEGDEFLT